MSWDKNLSAAERGEWDEFVRHVRTETVQGMMESAFVMSLVPEDKPDIKFAVELGLAIMLDKPIVAVTMPGRKVPPGLRKVATAVICADLDTEEGRRRAAAEFKKIHAKLGLGST
jgi:hypothetical protein